MIKDASEYTELPRWADEIPSRRFDRLVWSVPAYSNHLIVANVGASWPMLGLPNCPGFGMSWANDQAKKWATLSCVRRLRHVPA